MMRAVERRRSDRRAPSSPRSAGCGASRSPSRRASPRPSTGPRRRRSLHERGARWPGCVQARDRRRAEGRGGSYLHVRAGSTPSRGGCRVSDELQLPHAASRSSSFAAPAAHQRLCGARRNRPRRSSRRSSLLGPRSIGRHPPRGPGDTRPAAGAARRPTTRCSTSHFLGSEAVDHAGAEDEEVVRRRRRKRTRRGRNAAVRRSQRVRLVRRPAPRRWSNAASARKRDRTMPCASFARGASARLPRRRGYRRMRARARPMCRSARARLRESVRNDGEVMRLRPAEAARCGQRKVSCC